MTGQDDVVVANRILHEINGLCLVAQLDNLLCAAQVWLCLIANESSLSNKPTIQTCRNLEDGNITFFNDSDLQKP